MFGPMMPVRYLLLLMGCYSFFAGFIYNDFSSMPLAIWDSCYSTEGLEPDEGSTSVWAERTDYDCVYPVGIDPVWYTSEDEIAFLNGLKMKISVIYGVGQMLLGTTMKGFNAVYHRDWIEFFFEVVA